MAADPGDKKAKSKARSDQYQRRKAKELAKKVAEEEAEKPSVTQRDAIELAELAVLAKRTASQPTDADRDIDFAYKNSGNPTITPLMAPSLGAWKWYEYARNLPDKFLEICAKREDAKSKMAGTVTNQRMEDDKRQQFAMIDRIERQLTIDVKAMVRDLMDKFPQDVLTECRKYDAAWQEFLAREKK